MSKFDELILMLRDEIVCPIEVHLEVKSPLQALFSRDTILPLGSSQEISYVSTTQMLVALAYVNSFQMCYSVVQEGSVYST